MPDENKIAATSDSAARTWSTNKLAAIGARFKKLLAGKDQSLLVIDTNKQTTSLALVTVNKNQSSLEYISATQTTNPGDDLNTLITRLNTTDYVLPKRAILVCNELALTLLDLPSDPENPITDLHMQEFVHWEIEQAVNEQSAPPSVIELLIHQKHLDHHDLELIYEVFKSNNQVITPALIYQELIDSNAITQQSFDACQRLHQVKMTENEDIDCTWSRADFELSESNTICVGIKIDYKKTWLAAFDQCDLRLLNIFSSQLSPAALIIDRAKLEENQDFIFLDLGVNDLSLQKVSDGNISQSNHINIQDSVISANDIYTLCQPFIDDNTIAIYWQAIHPMAESVIAELQEKLTIPIKPSDYFLAPSDQLDKTLQWSSHKAAAARVIGASDSLLHITNRPLAVGLAGHPPPPPVFKQTRFQLAIAVFMVVTGIAIQEIYFFSKISGLEKESQALSVKLENKKETNEKIESINNEVAKLNDQLGKLREESATLSTRANLIETILIERQDFSQALLPILENTIPNEVLLTSVLENDWYQFNVKGWALTQSSIDNFNSVLSRKLEAWDMYISDSPSNVNAKRYDFTFIIRARDL
jgi:Tfp pilus assembly protein PilN